MCGAWERALKISAKSGNAMQALQPNPKVKITQQAVRDSGFVQ